MAHVHTFVTLVVIVALLVSGAAPVSGLVSRPTGATDVGADRSAQVDDASASFGEQNVSVTRGDEVTITVSHSEAANLTVGGPEYGFHLSVALGGSGTTEVVIDTRRTTAADPNEFVEGGSPTLHSRPIDEPLEPEDYLMRVEIDGVEYDLGTLTVEPRGETTVERYRAPGAFPPEEYVGDGEDGDADVGELQGTMTAGSTVARGDYAVLRIEESGLETAVNGSDLTGSAAANGLKVNFTQVDPGPNHQPREYVATDSADVAVLPNLAEDEIYVLWNTSGVDIESQTERNRYRAEFSLTGESGFVDSTTTLATTTFQLERQTVSLSPANDSTHYPWDDDAFVVTGETNRAPNTALEVRLRSPDPNAFLQLREVTVGPDGGFETSFALGSVSRGTNATLWVRNHFLETAQEVHLVAPDPSVRLENQTVNGTAVTVASAEVPAGGFVRLVDENGSPVGRSEYLDPGRHDDIAAELGGPLFETQTLRAELVRAGEDGSYDADAEAYTANGSAVSDSARIEFPPAPTETSTATQTATTTATRTATATPYPVETRTPLPPSGVSQSSLPLSPGVTIAALLGAGALLARRGGSA
jgi:hypothetical protein